MRAEDRQYRHADTVNRSARLGLLVLVALVVGAAFGIAELTGPSEPPPATILGAVITQPVPATTTTTAPSRLIESEAPRGPEDPRAPDRSILQVATTTTTTVAPPTTQTPARRAVQPVTTTTNAPATTSTTLPPTTTTTTTTTTLSPTTTTTTIPPTTTTTTAVEPEQTIHLYRLKGSQRGSDESPFVRIEVQVRNDDGKNQRNVVVSGRFEGVYETTVTGTTNNKGKVIFETPRLSEGTLRFTITGLSHPDYAYAPSDNEAASSISFEIEDD